MSFKVLVISPARKAQDQHNQFPESLFPKLECPIGITSGPPYERAALLSQALTSRKNDVLWCARGGYGGTEIAPLLSYLLPKVIASKVFIGFSDNSYLGIILSTVFKDLTYIHSDHAHQDMENRPYGNILKTYLLEGKFPDFVEFSYVKQWGITQTLSGALIPINLSLAESLCSLPQFEIPLGSILFLEDCEEEPYKIHRKIDSLINRGWIDRCGAIVFGRYTQDTQDIPDEAMISFLDVMAAKLQKPIAYLPIFGHSQERFPLVAHSIVTLNSDKIKLSFSKDSNQEYNIQYSDLFTWKKVHSIHFSGIAGTGMVAAARLAVDAGYRVTGSDQTKIYPPMDKVVEDLNVTIHKGYSKDNILNNNLDLVVVSNALSLVGPDLKPHPEVTQLLNMRLPFTSFPRFLSKTFLEKSQNIVVTGTHGKTTTTWTLIHLFQELNLNPSYFVGGASANPKQNKSAALGDQNLFIMEGDEYDTALFDKGPKFLHYHPKILLINPVEYDHVDIYASLEAIIQEFQRLLNLLIINKGTAVVHWPTTLQEPLKRIAQSENYQKDFKIFCFTDQDSKEDCPYPLWKIEKREPLSDGQRITISTPLGEKEEFFIKLKGRHNALNTLGALASYHAMYPEQDLKKAMEALGNFLGVQRRLQDYGSVNDVRVYDDFAHHPTAMKMGILTVKECHPDSRILLCFEPKNATMRRNIFQNELIEVLKMVSKVYLCHPPQDERISQENRLDPQLIEQQIKNNVFNFYDYEQLFESLKGEIKKGDVVIFMSSGSFGELPQKTIEFLKSHRDF